ncbi:putative uncharacterized protein [Parachlamydia acanthamoebae UV-7]|uniref:Uncharacterized protein n=1 Tax=Parachlamydia acanthamoebae (strain UV7) TaxID=765952 RepID=F8KX02_PARAV|nr:hypothetical protein [Parachlamydia acanthamoebae]CCB85469.1 putative uncharacterized protein [Parachlamydia acanthamoebae UV-7]
MQCLITNDLPNGQYDFYVANIQSKQSAKSGQQKLKISLVSNRAFHDMEIQSSKMTLPDRAFVPSLHTEIKYSTSFTRFTSGTAKIRNFLTTSYAKLDISNDVTSLTISPLYINQFRENLPVKVICYNDQDDFEDKKNKVHLGAMQIYAFAEEEFKYEYIQAAHRSQKFLSFTIFKQTEKKSTGFFGRLKNAWQVVDEDYVSYKQGIPYDIESEIAKKSFEYQRKFLGFSIESSKKTNSDTSFASAPPYTNSDEEFQSASSYSGSPESPPPPSMLSSHRGFAINQSPSSKILGNSTSTSKRGPIEDYNEIVDEIDRILGDRGLNRESNSEGIRKFTISMHFKHPSSDPEAILLTTWLPKSSNGQLSKPKYGVPATIEINFDDETSEKFECILQTSAGVPLDDPRWEGWYAKMAVPRTCEEARKNAVYEAYLDALVVRHLFKSALHGNSPEAKRKYTSIYYNQNFWTDIVTHIDYADHNLKRRWEYHYQSLKNRNVKSIGIGGQFEDPRPFILNIEKKIYRVHEGKFQRIKENPESVKNKGKRKEKVLTGVDKIKAMKFVVDQPIFAP